METGQNRDDAPVKPQCPRTPHTQHQDVICRPNTDPPGTPRDDDVMQSRLNTMQAKHRAVGSARGHIPLSEVYALHKP